MSPEYPPHKKNDHRSPGNPVDGGPLAEILVGRSADNMASLVGIAPDLQVTLAAHIALQLMDGRRLRPPHGIQRDGLMRVAAQAFDFEIATARHESRGQNYLARRLDII
jgi:hypothetical protein